MPTFMPSQVVQTIDGLFPHAASNTRGAQLMGNSTKLFGILNLIKDVPAELIALSRSDYAELVLAQSTIRRNAGTVTARFNAIALTLRLSTT